MRIATPGALARATRRRRSRARPPSPPLPSKRGPTCWESGAKRLTRFAEEASSPRRLTNRESGFGAGAGAHPTRRKSARSRTLPSSGHATATLTTSSLLRLPLPRRPSLLRLPTTATPRASARPTRWRTGCSWEATESTSKGRTTRADATRTEPTPSRTWPSSERGARRSRCRRPCTETSTVCARWTCRRRHQPRHRRLPIRPCTRR